MKTASPAFTTAFQDYSREITNTITITDGTNTETYTNADIYLNETSSVTDYLSIGGAFSNKLTLKIYEPKNTIAYNIGKITLTTKILYQGNTYTQDLGHYRVNKATTTDDYETLDIEAYDNMALYRTIEYTYHGTLPITDNKILTDLKDNYGITFATSIGTNGYGTNTTIEKIPQCSVGELLGWLAGLMGRNALIRYNSSVIFKPITGSPTTSPNTTILRSHQHERGLRLTYQTPIKINSVTAGYAGKEYTAGNGAGVTFENPFMTQARVNAIYNSLKDFEYYVGSVDWFGNPAVEVGDKIYVRDKNNKNELWIMSNLNWNFTGGCFCELQSVGNPDAAIKFDTGSPLYQKIAADLNARIENVDNAWKKEVASVTKLFGGSSDGVVRFIDTNNDGVNDGIEIHGGPSSPNTYLRINQSGLAISSDNGATYTNAITKNGIIATRITSGELKLGGTGTSDVTLGIYDSTGKIIGRWTENGLQITNNNGSTWTTTLTATGINASTITTGNLNLGNKNNNDTVLYVRDGNGKIIGKWDKDGLQFTGDNGATYTTAINSTGIAAQAIKLINLGNTSNNDAVLYVRNASGQIIGRWSNQGLQFTKDNGATYTTAINANGVNATAITTGNLNIGDSNGAVMYVKDNSGNIIARWNKNGLAFTSDNGATYTTAMNSNGITANAITMGQLSIGNTNNNDAVIYVKDNSGKIIARWDRNGLAFTSNNGSSYTVAMNGNGITANAITSGKLDLGKASNDTILRVYDANGKIIGRWNNGGIAFTKDNGTTWHTALNANGITADAITTGTLKVGGTGAATDPVIKVYNSSNQLVGQWDANKFITQRQYKYTASNYSTTDKTRINNIVLGTVTPTAADYTKLDINKDGKINLLDATLVQRMLNGQGNLTVTNYVELCPDTSTNMITVRSKADYASGTDVNLDSFVATSSGANVNSLSIGGEEVKKFITEYSNGGSNGVSYNKYNDGTVEIWGRVLRSWPAGDHTETVNLPINIDTNSNVSVQVTTSAINSEVRSGAITTNSFKIFNRNSGAAANQWVSWYLRAEAA